MMVNAFSLSFPHSSLSFPHRRESIKRRLNVAKIWIPASAGMTEKSAGMTDRVAGMIKEEMALLHGDWKLHYVVIHVKQMIQILLLQQSIFVFKALCFTRLIKKPVLNKEEIIIGAKRPYLPLYLPPAHGLFSRLMHNASFFIINISIFLCGRTSSSCNKAFPSLSFPRRRESISSFVILNIRQCCCMEIGNTPSTVILAKAGIQVLWVLHEVIASIVIQAIYFNVLKSRFFLGFMDPRLRGDDKGRRGDDKGRREDDGERTNHD